MPLTRNILIELLFASNTHYHIFRYVSLVHQSLQSKSFNLCCSRQTQVKSTAFVAYICDQILPKREEISKIGNEQKLDIFKLLAELSTNCGPLEDVEKKIQVLYDTLVVSHYL